MSVDTRIRRALSTTAAVDKLLRRVRCQIDFARASMTADSRKRLPRQKLFWIGWI
jgi:hypothetical protein